MSVDIGCGADLRVAQSLRNGYAVHAVEIWHGGHCVAECVGVDVRQTVPLAELAHPVRYAVRVHGAAGVLGKDIALALVVLTKAQALCILPYPTGTAEAPDLRCTCALRPSHPPARALRDGSSARKALACMSFSSFRAETTPFYA